MVYKLETIEHYFYNIITQKYYMVENGLSLSIKQQKLILFLTSLIKSDKDYPYKHNPLEYEFEACDYYSLLGIDYSSDSENYLHDICETLQSLYDKRVTVTITKGITIYISLIDGVEFNSLNSIVKVNFNPSLAPSLFKVIENIGREELLISFLKLNIKQESSN